MRRSIKLMKTLFLLLSFTFIVKSMTVSSSKPAHFYPIGTLGQPWNDKEKAEWRDSREIQRSYKDQVVQKIDKLKDRFNVSNMVPCRKTNHAIPCIVSRQRETGRPMVSHVS